VKEKVLAAHRAGLETVILPRRNEQDLEEVPEEVRDAMRFVFADMIDEVWQHALVAPLPLPGDGGEDRAEDGASGGGDGADSKGGDDAGEPAPEGERTTVR
jgi:ATP-dependent Lon protease